MKLEDYRKTQGLSRAKAGAQLGVDGITIWRWERGRNTPNAKQMRAVIAWSKGQVTADELLAAGQEAS